MKPRQPAKFFKQFGNRCKEIRLKKGLTQEDMADYGFSTRFYQRIEAGKPIHFKTVLKLSQVFSMPLSELFKGL